jgi:hypothetical protein
MIKLLKFQNKIFNKALVMDLITKSFSEYGKTRTTFLVNALKDLGFYYATKSGLSISLNDLKVPLKKKALIVKTKNEINLIKLKYKSGQLTFIEHLNLILNSWQITTNSLQQMLVSFLQNKDPFNSIYLMVFSGARGNLSQVKQLMGMRGLISDSKGQLIQIPIIHNFCEGLTLTDYLMSTYGARKGIVDTALKTADAGYFTRRLINSINDIIIRDLDCFTTFFIKIYKITSKIQFIRLILGRTSVDDIYDFNKQCFLVYKNTCITLKIANNIYLSDLRYIRVYSVLTCKLANSICKKCYGWDLSLNKSIKLGDAIGVIAAQSIGEPATQLTMRTFHTGGSFTLASCRQIFAKFTGIISIFEQKFCSYFRTSYGSIAQILNIPLILKLINHKNISYSLFLSSNTLLYVFNKQFILKQSLIAEIPNTDQLSKITSIKSIIAPHSGELLLLPKLNAISLLKGIVYEFPYFSFLNNIFSLKFFFNSYLFFKFKVYSLISGFLEYSFDLNLINDLKFISAIHLFLFPIFWDRFLKRNIFLNSHKQYFIFFENCLLNRTTNFSIFAQQKTFLYDLNHSVLLNSLDNVFTNFDFNSIFFYKILLGIPSAFAIKKIISLNFKKKHKFILNKHINFFLFFRYPIYLLKNIFLLKNINLYFPGEFLFNFIEIKFLSKVFIRKGRLFFSIFVYPVKTLIFSKIKNYKEASFAISLYSQILFFPNDITKNSLLYSGRSEEIFHNILWLKANPLLFISSKLYNYKNFYYLSFSVFFLNLVKLNFCQRKMSSLIKFYYFQLNLFEYCFKNTLLGFLSMKIQCLGHYKFLKKFITVTPRLLVLKSNHFYTYYFETLKRLKTNSVLSLFANSILPFVKIYLSGVIKTFSQFSITLNLATSFFITQNTQIFHSFLNFIKQNEVIGFISFDQTLTGDIVQGLPKLEELLELRHGDDFVFYSESSGVLLFQPFFKNVISIKGISKYIISSNRILSKNIRQDTIFLKFYDFILFGKILSSGTLNFKKLLNVLFFYFLRWQTLYLALYASFKKIQILLVKKILMVYLKQKILVSLKHIEVLVSQLTNFVKIIYDYSNSFIFGEIIKIIFIQNINTTFRLYNKKFIYYKPFIMGLTNVSESTTSFFSSASFQKTTKILSIAAIEGQIDWLFGIKENIMLGQNLPFGESFF